MAAVKSYDEKCHELSIEEFRAQSKSYLDNLHVKENEIARLLAENIRLRGLVHAAYNEGFIEGGREYSSFHGGKPWGLSNAHLALQGIPSLQAKPFEHKS